MPKISLGGQVFGWTRIPGLNLMANPIVHPLPTIDVTELPGNIPPKSIEIKDLARGGDDISVAAKRFADLATSDLGNPVAMSFNDLVFVAISLGEPLPIETAVISAFRMVMKPSPETVEAHEVGYVKEAASRIQSFGILANDLTTSIKLNKLHHSGMSNNELSDFIREIFVLVDLTGHREIPEDIATQHYFKIAGLLKSIGIQGPTKIGDTTGNEKTRRTLLAYAWQLTDMIDTGYMFGMNSWQVNISYLLDSLPTPSDWRDPLVN